MEIISRHIADVTSLHSHAQSPHILSIMPRDMQSQGTQLPLSAMGSHVLNKVLSRCKVLNWNLGLFDLESHAFLILLAWRKGAVQDQHRAENGGGMGLVL